MKRAAAILCVIALVITAVPAYAGGVADQLPEITLKVKQALDIGDEFDDFTGDYYDGMWSLSWSSDAKWINVSCSGEGEVFDYYMYEDTYSYSSDYAPRYPLLDDAAISDIAEEFLGRVVSGENMCWLLDDIGTGISNVDDSDVSVTGCLTIMDQPTDIRISMTIDPLQRLVTSYYRSDSYRDYNKFSGDTSINVSAGDALALLRDSTRLECVYRVPDGGGPARLVYAPVYDNTKAVRAADGVVVDASVTEDGYYDYAADVAAETVEDEAGGASLTEAELAGIAVYDGAMSVDELDAMLRGMPELGLTDVHVLTGSNYYVLGYAGGLCAILNYSRPLTEDELNARMGGGFPGSYSDDISITMNAMTGRLVSLYSYYAGYGGAGSEVAVDGFQDVAMAFIEKYLPEYADNIELVSSGANSGVYGYAPSADFEYVRTYNGFCFYANNITINVNAETGCIDTLYINWDDAQEFTDAPQTVDYETAMNAYLSGFDIGMMFLSLPADELADGSTVYELTLCWRLENISGVYSVDAMTGEANVRADESGGFVYDDIAGHEQEEIIARLGSCGAGFSGGSFRPDDGCTLRDALVIISQTGYYYADDPENQDISQLKDRACRMGAPDLSMYAEDQVLTRGQLAGILAHMSGYGKAAQLAGIYDCGFADDDDIPGDEYGLIAIAYGMGLLETDENGCINADSPLTRAEAALIFHRLFSMK